MRQLLCGFLAAGLFLVPASWAQEDNAAKAILDKAIKAHGGAENLAKLKVRQEKANGTTADGKTPPFTSDSLIQP